MTATEQPGQVPERFLGFRVGCTDYAILMEQVSGLADCGPLRQVLGTPPEVLGLSEWRGRILTVLDLPSLLGEPEQPGPVCLIRLSGTMTRTALRVPAPVTFKTADGHCTAGRLAFDGNSYTVVDPAELVTRLEAEMLAGTSDAGS